VRLRRSTHIPRPPLGEHPPIGMGCMLAVLTMWAIALGAIAWAAAYALFSWRFA
jgi:hypothetical protein